LKHRTRIAHQLVKIVRRELRDSARALTTNDDSPFEDVVHESRKSVKKVRAVTTLLDAAGAKLPRKDRKRLKAAARSLSRLRDSGAIIEAFDRVRRRYPKQLPEHTYQILRRGLVAARDREEARAKRDGVVSEAADRLAATRKSAGAWAIPSIDVSRLLVVIAASYVRGRKAMRGARETEYSATLHRWRKAVKTLWYQLRLAQPLTTGLAPLIADLNRLETELGDDHNLVVLAATLRACDELRSMSPAIRQIDRLAVRMRRSLRRRAFARGRRLFVRKRKRFHRWMRRSVKRPGRQHREAA